VNSTASEGDQQILARGWDVRAAERPLFYLYRAIDPGGATIDFYLSAFRSADAAKALLAKARRFSSSAAGN